MMWIDGKKILIENLVNENGKIVEYENIPVMTGLGDETIWRCTFENGAILDVEFMPNECRSICSNMKS